MPAPRFPTKRLRSGVASLVAASLAFAPVSLHAQRKKANPTSKVYVTDVEGEAVIDTGNSVEDVSERSVYTAQGTVIETKKADDAAGQKNFSTMVYSNGTGAYFDADTRLEVKKFEQEPFTPNRTDMDTEPSVSQTSAFLARGAVGLCNSKMVAGSSMSYQTPQGSVNVRGRKVVIEANSGVTKVSMLEGESTVRGGPNDMGGHTVHSGEQAIIRSNGAGLPPTIDIIKIPPTETAKLDEKVTMACQAKKTVYFEAKEKKVEGGSKSDSDSKSSPGSSDNKPSGDSSSDGNPFAQSGGGNSGAVNAFTGADDRPTVTELVPVQVVPVNLPVDLTLSKARVENPPPGGG